MRGSYSGNTSAFQADAESSILLPRSIFKDTGMDVEQASYFLTSTILVMLGLVVIAIGVTAINNVIHRYWKPVKIFTPDSWKAFNPPMRYTENASPDTEPVLKGKK